MTLIAGLVVLGAVPAGAVTSGVNGRIVDASDSSGSLQVYAMRPDGTAPVQLTTLGTNYDPAYNGDGSQIAFISTRNGSPQLFKMTATGGSQTQVVTAGLTPSHPTWAPNGSAIGFAGLKGTDSDIYTVKPAGTGLVDLTPDLTSFDADPQWSPGGITIAFDRTDANGNTNIWSIQQTGINLKQLTTSNHDSNPSWSPDNKTIAFQSARDSVTGPVPFAGISQPVGMAFTQNGILITQQKKDKVSIVSASGAVSLWATLPSTGNADIERYIAVSPGLGCFAPGEVYVSVKQTIYQIDPITKAITTFATISDLPNSNNFLVFDTVGTFGYDLIVVAGQRSKVYTVDCTGTVVTQIADLSGTTAEIEGSDVAPMTFIPFPGYLIVASKFDNSVYAVAPGSGPNNSYSFVGTWPSPEQAIDVPAAICNWDVSGGAYFLNSEGANETFKVSANSFPAGLAGSPSLLVTSEDPLAGIGLFTSNGTTIDISTLFPGPIGVGDGEETDFAGGCSTRLAPATSQAAILPNQIYTMSSSGLNQTRITNNSFDDVRPAWSPDGTSIVFASNRDDPNQPGCVATSTCLYEIYTMSSAGANQTDISNDLSFNDTSPDWESVAYAPVTVDDFFYNPATDKPKLGGTMLWEFYSEHTVTDATTMGLFDSGTMEAGQFFVFNFVAAGQYPYVCLIHPTLMTGNVRVPMRAVPSSGTQTTSFTITWVSGTPLPGYTFTVQIKRPGSTMFVDWKPNTLLKTAPFVPDGGIGVYSFQARLQNASGQSGYSAAVSINVTS
jgi:plastocyanin